MNKGSAMYFKALAVLLLLSISMSAAAKIEIYSGLLIGGTQMDETSGSNSFKHTNMFFIGHLGYDLGARFKLQLGRVGIGAIGEISWVGDTFDRKQIGVVNDSSYRYESFRLLGGATTSFKFGALSLIAEYYPWIKNTVSYSDGKTENPYRRGDIQKPTGFGVGFSYEFGAGISYSTLYRKLTYKDVQMNGVSVKLPNPQYSALVIDEVLACVMVAF